MMRSFSADKEIYPSDEADPLVVSSFAPVEGITVLSTIEPEGVNWYNFTTLAELDPPVGEHTIRLP